MAENDMPRDLTSPPTRSFVVAPHNTDELPLTPRALYFSAAGNVRFRLSDDVDPVTISVPAGMLLPGFFAQVYLTGTTVAAGSITAFV
jgi:hypothetical protein